MKYIYDIFDIIFVFCFVCFVPPASEYIFVTSLRSFRLGGRRGLKGRTYGVLSTMCQYIF
jgi:hypothetical protein